MSSRSSGKLLQGGGERVEDSGREGASEGGDRGGRVWGSGHEPVRSERPPVKDRVAIRHLGSWEKHSLPPGDSFLFYFILFHLIVFHFQTSKFTSEKEIGICGGS